MPAAAVIPAPKAYIKVVAVKKLVVEPGRAASVPAAGVTPGGRRDARLLAARPPALHCAGGPRDRVIYCEKIRVFKAGVPLEYISME